MKAEVNDKRPFLVMMIGLPGSGKSTEAEAIQRRRREMDFQIHSSDALRAELYGDESTQGDNNALFEELHRRIFADLNAGKNVIYDATNLNKKRRVQFIREAWMTGAICMAALCILPYEICLERNAKRERVVPIEAMEKMYRSFQPPHIDEGFDEIYIFDEMYADLSYRYGGYDLDCKYENAMSVDQETKFHTLNVFEHCKAASESIFNWYIKGTYNFPFEYDTMFAAAWLHDCGKPKTKTRLNKKGEDDGNCHYYNHESVGAYDSFFWCRGFNLDLHTQMKMEKYMLDVANLVYFHMMPFLWDGRENVKKPAYMSEQMFEGVKLLHEADKAAH